MHPAISVILLTTLIGTGQGVVITLYLTEFIALLHWKQPPAASFFLLANGMALLLLLLGLLASFFHLGHPERAWRSAAMWRTSWLSREVIVLPALMFFVLLYGAAHHFAWKLNMQLHYSFVIGCVAAILSILLFVCTGMIYACIRFLQEWATPLTVVNYTVLGLVSGMAVMTAYAAYTAPDWVMLYRNLTLILLCIALVTRSAALVRNSRIKHKSNLQTAIGIKHQRITQRSQGFMGGAFNTEEFFHHAPLWLFRNIKWIFLALVFGIPIVLLGLSFLYMHTICLPMAAGIMYIGLLIERWYFFADANHPQNLYYQTIS